MSTTDFKNSWEEAIRKAALASHSKNELTDPDLEAASGLPLRSGLKVGAMVLTAFNCPTGGCTWNCSTNNCTFY
jgi:hypothetical protein